MTGKNRHFRDLSQQVLSGVVAGLNVDFLKFFIDFLFFMICFELLKFNTRM